MNSMLYIVHGIGTDAVGLVGAITSPIARAGGNVVDMRQDVLHGMFTIHLVVDLAPAEVSVKDFRSLVERIGGDTGLRLTVDKFTPHPLDVEKRNILLTLVGRDRSGIIAAISEKLGTYNVNIETSDVVAREGIFLMDLLCDVSRSALPLENLRGAIRDAMLAMRIDTMFQTADVFNKKKKIVLFDIAGSFMDSRTMKELLRQASIPAGDVGRGDPARSDAEWMQETARYLEGLPLSVVDEVMRAVEVSRGTRELLQTLRMMGYKVGLVSTGFDFFTTAVKARLGIDYAFGFELPVNEDSREIAGDLPAGEMHPLDRDDIVAALRAGERVGQDDVTVISDGGEGDAATPGIRLIFDTKALLDLVNQHALSKGSLTGMLRSFGIPRL